MKSRTIKDIVTEMQESGNIHLTATLVNEAICYYPLFLIGTGILTEADTYKDEFRTSTFILNGIMSPAIQVIEQINIEQQPAWDQWIESLQKVNLDQFISTYKKNWIKIFRDYNDTFDFFNSLPKNEDKNKARSQANEFVTNMLNSIETMLNEKTYLNRFREDFEKGGTELP